jgi:glutathione S-transferase
LNYKGIPHKTVFVKPFEFAARCAELNLPANDVDGDDPPRNKFPIIHDSTTGQAVCDSTRIILYLDRTYPDTPRVIPAGAEALAVAFDDVVRTHIAGAAVASLVTRNALWIDETSKAGYHQIVETMVIKMPVEDFFAAPEIEKGIWEKAEAQFGVVDKLLQKTRLVSNGTEDGLYLGGKTVTYADICIGAVLTWAKRTLGGAGQEHWQRLAGWNEGRWVKLHNVIQAYTTIHE